MITLAIDPGARPGWAVFDGLTLIAAGKGLAPRRKIDVLVIERPESRGGNTRTPVDHLISLAIEAGRALGRHEGDGVAVRWAKASEWSPVPKPVRHRRARARLVAGELEVLGPSPSLDTLDAVSLGLWALGRL